VAQALLSWLEKETGRRWTPALRGPGHRPSGSAQATNSTNSAANYAR